MFSGDRYMLMEKENYDQRKLRNTLNQYCPIMGRMIELAKSLKCSFTFYFSRTKQVKFKFLHKVASVYHTYCRQHQSLIADNATIAHWCEVLMRGFNVEDQKLILAGEHSHRVRDWLDSVDKKLVPKFYENIQAAERVAAAEKSSPKAMRR